MKPAVDKEIHRLLNTYLTQIEEEFKADVLTYFGHIYDGIENHFLSIVEELKKKEDAKDHIVILLTTPGGSATTVERMVNIIRHNYKEVSFIVPDYAYSAGTIFCMSGDNIHMDYFSVLGPIDPQVQNKENKWVPALGYLDKIEEFIGKASQGTLSQAEFLILKDFDLAELKGYEQAKDLTIDLLKKWLTDYKFKNWSVHSDGRKVTLKDKEDRAKEIALALGDYKKWKSHGRPISINELTKLKLKIEDYSSNNDRKELIRDYYNTLKDYIQKSNFEIFLHTKYYI